MIIDPEITAYVIENTQHKEIFKISYDGDIFYRFNDEMIKVNCPEEIQEAFLSSVFYLTDKEPDDVLIEKYIQKILNHERSNEYITKLESIIRKFKLAKLNKI